jgi:uncharacterized protein
MKQHLSMLMLPSNDVTASRRFYEDGLGWTPVRPASARSVMYRTSGILLVLLDRAYLEKESGLKSNPGAPGVVPVINVPEKADVDRVRGEVLAAGGKIPSEVRMRDGGLYTFYFTDPDGNAWEVVWSPQMAVDENGLLALS